ncbi:MAG: hypothetical protein U9R08_02765 [Nanoarchaeota archaeon]|nr:hypothetical protein [Nanoarchaeota archaeon]
MTNKEILKEAIMQAIRNGFDDDTIFDWIGKEVEQYNIMEKGIGLESIIFSHDFAKAFWKKTQTEPKFLDLQNWMLSDEEVPTYCGEIWQYHLQEMVLCEDPIKYLEQFIE